MAIGTKSIIIFYKDNLFATFSSSCDKGPNSNLLLGADSSLDEKCQKSQHIKEMMITLKMTVNGSKYSKKGYKPEISSNRHRKNNLSNFSVIRFYSFFKSQASFFINELFYITTRRQHNQVIQLGKLFHSLKKQKTKIQQVFE